jgi:hypothetical protein
MRMCLAVLALSLAIVASPGAQPPARTIAVTIDDLPGSPADAPLGDLRGMTTAILDALISSSP